MGVVSGGGGGVVQPGSGLGVAMTGLDPTMVVAVSPPSGMTGQVVSACGGADGSGSWDLVSGLVAERVWWPKLPLASTVLDA